MIIKRQTSEHIEKRVNSRKLKNPMWWKCLIINNLELNKEDEIIKNISEF